MYGNYRMVNILFLYCANVDTLYAGQLRETDNPVIVRHDYVALKLWTVVVKIRFIFGIWRARAHTHHHIRARTHTHQSKHNTTGYI